MVNEPGVPELAKVLHAAIGLSFTVTDPHQPDNPLVWANSSFARHTGYPLDEILGRNCRFLQGPATDQQAVARIREALDGGEPVTEVLLNYRKDGTAFWNEVAISPVIAGGGRVAYFVGVQTDVTGRVLAERERRAALTTAEEAQGELRLLTEATAWMSGSLDVGETADRLARSVVPELADFCCVDLLTDSDGDRARRMAVHHREPAQLDALHALAATVDPRVGGDDGISQVLTTGEPILVSDMPDRPRSASDDAETLLLYQQLRPRSAMLVPLRARNRVLGVLTLCSEQPYGRRYGNRNLVLAADLADRAALAVDNARLYAREHDAAETLQLSLLPRVSQAAGLRVAARYLVGGEGARVGGDWYDLLPLPDGAVGLAVGDVVGHDLGAAAAMGQHRAVLRSYAWEGLRSGAVLDRCDQLVQGLEMASMATAFYGRLGPARGSGERELVYANAGHPPPLLRLPHGTAHLLDSNLSPLLGAMPGVARSEAAICCSPGSLLLLYTDGLIDVPGHDPDKRERRLQDLVQGAPRGCDVEDLCDRVIEDMVPDRSPSDDIALLAILIES